MTLPIAFEERMKQLLGSEEYEAFRAALEQDRSRGLRLNPLKLPRQRENNELSGQQERVDDKVPSWEQARPVQSDVQSEQQACSTHDARVQECAEFLQQLLGWEETDGLQSIPWAAPYGFWYSEEERPGKSPLHEAGLYYLQEPSAMSVAALAGARPGEKVLDLCAAPGGKSTQLAGAMLGKGLLVSNEIHPARAKILSQNMERLGVPNVIVTNESPERLAERFGSFYDRVIVDAPCSGEGMFRKEEQALTGWSPENVEQCAKRQAGILDQAAVMVKPGGRLIYSTCTFAPAEDEETIEGFLMRHPEFTLVDLPAELGDERMTEYGFAAGHPEWSRLSQIDRDDSGTGASSTPRASRTEGRQPEERTTVRESLNRTIRLWPHRLRGEGHFAAVLQKEGNWQQEPIPACKGSLQTAVTGLEGILKEGVLQRIAEAMGAGLMTYGEDLYLMPYKAQIRTDKMRILRPGLQIGQMKKNRMEPAHALAMALHPEDVVQAVCLDPNGREAAAYLRGESIPCDPALKGWTLVTAGGISMGWGKAANGMIKNHYPKGLRRPY